MRKSPASTCQKEGLSCGLFLLLFSPIMWDEEARKLCERIGFESEVGQWIAQRAGRKLEQLIGVEPEFYREIRVDGIAFGVKSEDANELLPDLRDWLQPRGYFAFWSTRREPNGLRAGEEIAVLRTDDPLEAVRIKGSDGANYDLFNEDVIAQLQNWRAEFDVQIIGAGHDFVNVKFERLPDDLCAFAEHIYDFCPDVIEQGFDLIDEDDDTELFERARALNCTPSSAWQVQRNQQNFDLESVATPEIQQLIQLAQESENPEDDALGLSLLAAELQRSGELFLWWD